MAPSRQDPLATRIVIGWCRPSLQRHEAKTYLLVPTVPAGPVATASPVPSPPAAAPLLPQVWRSGSRMSTRPCSNSVRRST